MRRRRTRIKARIGGISVEHKIAVLTGSWMSCKGDCNEWWDAEGATP
jgi:hypothetical protein